MDTDSVTKPGSEPTPEGVAHAGEPASRDAPLDAKGLPLPKVPDVSPMDTEPCVGAAAPSSGGQSDATGSTHQVAPQLAGSASGPPAEPVSDQNAMETEPATAASSSTAGQSSEVKAEPPSPESDAPALGTRIEVLWKISHDDGRVEERWWGAVVQDRLRTTVGSISAEHGDRFIHVLLYDAYDGFEEDVSRVAFLPDGNLLDISQIGDENKGILDWRIEGDGDKRETQVSLEEFVQANQRDLREAGVPDDADLAFLSGMPAHVQTHMTSGYRVFADGVKQMLAELSQKHPEGYVVTERDVQEWCEKMKRLT